MFKYIISCYSLCGLMACASNKIAKSVTEIPSCLEEKIKTMASDPHEGSPLSLTQYSYKDQTVYYIVSACCDKFNIVYDSVCNVLGYPDGGYTGRGDGKMNNFKKGATNRKLIWEKKKEE